MGTSDDKGNLEVRATTLDENMLLFAEAKRVEGVTPDAFKEFFDHWPDNIKSVNPLVIRSECVAEDEGFPVIKSEAKLPWPLANRLMLFV